MSPDSRTRRRLRVRRRPRGGKADHKGPDVPADVVADFGCCLVEAVAGAATIAGLLFGPIFLLD